MLYTDNFVHIFFGNKTTAHQREAFNAIHDQSVIHIHEPFSTIKKFLNFSLLATLRQVHGTQGIIIDSIEKAQAFKPYLHEGDFLITNVPGVALGVLTADCLPIVFVDKVQHVIALAHAGWKGAINGIVQQVVHYMQQVFGSHLDAIEVFFGPSAKGCCYEVTEEFIANIEESVQAVYLHKRGKTWFFDLPTYTIWQLQRLGISNIPNLTYNACTICTPGFCSYRLEKNSDIRQITLVTIPSR